MALIDLLGGKEGFYSPLTYNGNRVANYQTGANVYPRLEQDQEQGMIRFVYDNVNNNVYGFKFVLVASGSANLSAGNTVVYTNTNFNTVDTRHGQSICGVNGIAGVAYGVITAGNYGWIQIWGPCINGLTLSTGTAAVGDALIGVGTDLKCVNVAANTAPTNRVLGWVTVASTLTAIPAFGAFLSALV